jgi:hypothetical protein
VHSNPLNLSKALQQKNLYVYSLSLFQLYPSSKSATATHKTSEATNTFEITHPFHPLRGKKFIFTARMQLWGEDRITYFDQNRKLRSMLVSWTNVANTDYFLQASAGRSWFRVSDLSHLNILLQRLIKNRSEGVR